MDERKRPERDDEAQTDKEREEEREEEAGEKEDEEDRDEDTTEEEEEAQASPADAALHAAGVLELMHRVLHDKELNIDDQMPGHERRGLEMLYLARVGDTGTGNRASAGMRMQFLVEAFAPLAGDAQADLETSAAIALAARVAAIIDELLDGQDALVGAGDPAAARKGIFARLLGRKE